MSVTRSTMIRLASEFPKGSPGRKALLARLKEARPVAIQDAEVMLYAIDPDRNQSKFYEMRVVPLGRETRAQKTKDHVAGGTWVLERRWGRLTDKGGVTGRVDSINDIFAAESQARQGMAGIRMDKIRGAGSAAYTDVSLKREYPIGLGAAGFGWGGQAVCRVIPELQELLGHVQAAKGALRGLSRQENDVALKLSGWLNPMETYLQEQLAHCR
jgi:predicted DNA-binding WGR domain protein